MAGRPPGPRPQAEALSDRLAPLADENALAYRRARAALAGELPADLQERRDFTLGRLLERSAEVPARIAAAAADVAELAEVPRRARPRRPPSRRRGGRGARGRRVGCRRPAGVRQPGRARGRAAGAAGAGVGLAARAAPPSARPRRRAR